MLTFIGGISVIGMIVFIVMAIRSKKKQTGKTKNMWLYAAGCFVVLLICSSIDGGSSQTTNASSSKSHTNGSPKKAENNNSKPAASAEVDPDVKIDKDLENIVVTNVLNLTKPKFSHIEYKNDSTYGKYEVSGVVSGIDQSGKKVEYDFNGYTDGSKTIQWSTENTSTYKMATGTVDTSSGVVTTLK